MASTTHQIRLHNTTTFRLPPYRYSPAKKVMIAQKLEMLADRIIEPSTSSYSSPIVIVQKKDSNARFCVDYRRLNGCTRDESSFMKHFLS